MRRIVHQQRWPSNTYVVHNIFFVTRKTINYKKYLLSLTIYNMQTFPHSPADPFHYLCRKAYADMEYNTLNFEPFKPTDGSPALGCW